MVYVSLTLGHCSTGGKRRKNLTVAVMESGEDKVEERLGRSLRKGDGISYT